MMTKQLHRFIAALVAGLVLPVVLYAGTTGKISGRVVDSQSRETLVGVNVVLVGTPLGAATDVDGNFFIINIPPGKYRVRASAVGYTPMVLENVSVSVDQTTKLDFELRSQTLEVNSVVVTAQRPIVQKDLTSTTSTISKDQINNLPVENVSALVNLQAGVVEGHFRGGRSGEVKHLVDGVAVNDVFSGGNSLEPEVNSIQEIQVISGTFNAEYGEAMSGIVNQVTKISGDRFSGQIAYYTGGYFSSRENGNILGNTEKLYPNINRFGPSALKNYDGSVSGPVPLTGGAASFFLSGRYVYDDGFLYGIRKFNPGDSSNFSANDPAQWHIGSTGDNTYVPMNYSKRYTLQGKVSLDVGNSKGLTLQTIFQRQDYRDYNHAFRLNPDGDYKRAQQSLLGMLSYNHIFNAAAFLDAGLSVLSSDYTQRTYEDALDARYVNPERMQDAGANAFLTGGTQNWRFAHHTESYTGRLDFTWQATQIHQFKTGAEFKQHYLHSEGIQVHVDASSHFKPALAKPGDFDYNWYDNHPYQFAAYIQDKIELEYLIVNFGVRYDYFQPDGRRLINPDNIAALDSLVQPFPDTYFKKASVKQQVSPRIGISYPITNAGAIHISYGHFFQIPAFQYLYQNPNFRIPLTGNFPEYVGSTIGNADLEPQRTTMYEIGLQQQLFADIGVTVTGYYKDIRNLLGVEIHTKNDFRKFAVYVNKGYGAVQGFTVSLEKRMTEGFGGTIDYTYQVAKGDASDPNDDYNRAQANPPIESNRQLVPLNWDRRHSLNLTLQAGVPGDFIGSLISRLGSGLPYTPALSNQRTGLENSDNKPVFFQTDLYLTKYFTLSDMAVSVFLKVYNLFDTPNEANVFGDTGRAGYSLDVTRVQEAPRGVNTIQEYYSRPDYYSSPRQIILGATFSF